MATTLRRPVPTQVLLGAGGLVALVVTWVNRPALATDDAAITFRYAERLATGGGLTYNDGERVLGASSGLHTLLLAATHRAGLTMESAALFVGIAGTVACTVLVGMVAQRLAGRLAALVAMVVFVASPVGWHAAGGLESATLLTCCLAAVLARQEGRDRIAGLALGLALIAKLDAAALLVAIVAASLLVRRRLPMATLLWAGLAAAPWYLWVTWYYGHPFPQSFLSKAAGRADGPSYRYDPTWAVRRLRVVVPAGVSGVAVALGRRDRGPGWETRLVLAGWLLLGVAAVSLLPLGAPYPWYVAPLYVPIAILAGDAVAWARRQVEVGGSAAALAVAPLLLVGVSCAFGVRALAVDLADGRPTGPAERQWQDFRAAGRFVERHHPDQVVENCFGWVAYEAASARIADPCALNSPWPAGPADVVVDAVPLGQSQARPGWCDEARFDDAASHHDGGLVVIVRSRC